MKRFKRFIAIILTIICVGMLLTACSSSDVVTIEKEDTSKIYTDAKTNTESLAQLKTVKTVERVFSGDKGDFSDKTVTTVSRSITEEGRPVYLKNFQKTLTRDTETITESSIYCIDNMMYESSTDGKKTSYMAKENVITDNFKNIIPTIPAEALSNSTIYEGSDMTQIVSNADATTVHNLLHDFIGGISEYYSPVGDNDSFVFEYSTISINFDISGDYFKKIVIEFDADFSHQDGKSNVITTVTWNIVDPGSDVTVVAPENLNEYSLLNNDNSENETTDVLTAVDRLFGEMGEPLPEYDTIYEELCTIYDKESVDKAIEEYQQQH